MPEDTQVKDIKQALQKIHAHKLICMTWVRGHIGIEGNEKADQLVKNATTNKTVKRHFVPVPVSLVKRKTHQKLYTDWQADWNEAQTGTYTKKFFQR